MKNDPKNPTNAQELCCEIEAKDVDHATRRIWKSNPKVEMSQFTMQSIQPLSVAERGPRA